MTFKKKITLYFVVLAAFLAASTMSYEDEVKGLSYCEQMKADGTWPKGYNCG